MSTQREPKMSGRGAKIWKEMCRYVGERKILANPLEYFANEVLFVHSRTLMRRLEDDHWFDEELVSLQRVLKSKTIQQDIDQRYRDAINY